MFFFFVFFFFFFFFFGGGHLMRNWSRQRESDRQLLKDIIIVGTLFLSSIFLTATAQKILDILQLHPTHRYFSSYPSCYQSLDQLVASPRDIVLPPVSLYSPVFHVLLMRISKGSGVSRDTLHLLPGH